MRIGKALCFAAIMFVSCVLPLQASTISLRVLPPVQLGAGFDVEVLLNGAFAGPTAGDFVTGFGFNVTSGNSSILQYLYADVSPLFTDVSGFPGSPTVAALNFPGVDDTTPGFGDPLLLATLHFMALGSTPTMISVTGFAVDSPNEGVFYTYYGVVDIDARTTVTAAAVPEAGSLILLISGIPIVFLIRNRARLR